MTVEVESRLREALHARAAEVEPDPHTWEVVQARLRRSRQRRVVLAAAAAVTVAAVLALAGPALVASRVVEFDGPVADQPGEDVSGEAGPDAGADAGRDSTAGGEAAAGSCPAPAALVAVWSRNGDLWAACTGGQLVPLTATLAADSRPAIAPGAEAVVFARVEPGAVDPVLVRRGLGEDGEETVLGGGTLPALAPDGRLARVLDAGDGTALVHVSEVFAEPEHELGLPVAAADVRDLSWDPGGRLLLATLAGPGGSAVGSTVVTAEPASGEYRVVLPADAGYAAAAFAPDGSLGALRSSAGGLELVILDRAVLDGGEPRVERTIATDLGALEPASDELFLAPAGYVGVDVAGGGARSWRPAGEPSWFVGDGRVLSLVDASGSAVTLESDVDGAAANPALDSEGLARRAAENRRDEIQEAAEAELVDQARRRLQEAAAAGDVGALRDLMVPDFVFTFGGAADRDEAASYLEANPELVEQLPDLLAVAGGAVETEDGTLYVWPRAHALEPDEWTEADLADLRSLGASEQEIADWREAGGYLGWRAGIDTEGGWRFYVAGD